MNSNRRIFLDTSIQVERLIGQVAIERQLTLPNFGAVTSHYVLMEFQRSVVADYAQVYNQILHSQSWELAAQKLRASHWATSAVAGALSPDFDRSYGAEPVRSR
ncbi:MAG: hypothetical protein R2911_05240 [Caldilineaceae bacterium]